MHDDKYSNGHLVTESYQEIAKYSPSHSQYIQKI